MYLVSATPPKTGWTFPANYFPRKIRYKKEAEERAKEAEKQGGTNIKVEKVK